MISPIFIILTIISGMMVITAIHPVHSIIWLALSFIGAAIVFIQLQADFIALATLIIYVGAIAILFIFVLMMLNLLNFEVEHSIASVLPLGVISVLSLTTLIINLNCYDNLSNSIDIISLKEFSTLQIIGSELYGIYGPYLIMASLILLVAMIGAIVLTLQPSESTKRQNNFIQISRDLHPLPKNTDSFNN